MNKLKLLTAKSELEDFRLASLVGMASSAEDFNKPKSDNFFINSRGHKLHFRYRCASDGPDSALGSLFFLHGYAGHVNGPGIGNMMEYMGGRSVSVFCMDFEGHGYSEGERALIERREDLIDDFLKFVNFVMKLNPEHLSESAGFDAGFHMDVLERIRQLPFSVMGSSMGGAITALVSNSLMEYSNFAGSILLAPALSINPPNWMLVELLRHTVCRFTPSALMPSGLSSVSDNRASLKHDEALARAELDTWGLPGALGWNRGMRWATALMFIDMGSHIGMPETLNSFMFPFLIIHDPGDTICSIKGSRSMMAMSATSSEDKKMIEVYELLHNNICVQSIMYNPGLLVTGPRLLACNFGKSSRRSM